MSIEIDMSSNMFDAIGRDLINEGMSKDVISNAYRAGLRTVATKGKNQLKSMTPAESGWPVSAAGPKVDRWPDKLGVYALIGYLRPRQTPHQFWTILGTKQRTTKSSASPYYMPKVSGFRSTRSRGQIKPKKPDPFKVLEGALKGDAAQLTQKRIEKVIENATNKMNARYGNRWRPL